jgi:putative flavoprotein involved in K+ transport
VAPSTVVTGVSGGYDVNVRQMAADGIRVVGRVIGASDGTLAIARNANEILDEADEACAGFLAAAREFAAANPEVGLAEEEPPVSAALPATVAEVESLRSATPGSSIRPTKRSSRGSSSLRPKHANTIRR